MPTDTTEKSLEDLIVAAMTEGTAPLDLALFASCLRPFGALRSGASGLSEEAVA